ncbi:MAG TPA: hypothetical protein VJ867_11370 [Gemmatimonadaceae bacterium]|nr:hypothetical protein [Gemmatimonadaceae bacterium]
MTVLDWVREHTRDAPSSLVEYMTTLIGAGGSEPESRTAAVCIDSAVRGLEQLVRDARFAREDASQLLAIDALTTLAFEHAAQTAATAGAIGDAAEQSARALGTITDVRG